jgi:peroxiredoxin Q/BCP
LRQARFVATIRAVPQPSVQASAPVLRVLPALSGTGLACVALACLASVACATPSSTAGTPATSAAAASAPEPTASAPVAAASAAPSAAGPAADAPDELVGKAAPDFTSKAQDGTSVHLAAFKGKRVVVYFYPKDETPGCTKEACSFRDAWQDIAKTGAVLIGISADSSDSHKDFVAHYKLPFLLLSDPDGKIGQSYGVPFAGHHQRQTFVIGPDGNVLKVYRKVDVTVHASQILADLTHA